MMRLQTVFVATLAILPACAGPLEQRALQAAMVAKPLVDAAAEEVTQHVDSRVNVCAPLAGQGETLRQCLGPVAGNPDEVELAFESVRLAQEALYLVLIRDDRAALMNAFLDLKTAVERIVELSRRVRSPSE